MSYNNNEFYFGFLIFFTSTIGFIFALLTPYWIVNTTGKISINNGIIEICKINETENFKICFNLLMSASSFLDPSIFRPSF